MEKYILAHYAEIGVKGKNKRFFELKLKENIKKVLPAGFFLSVSLRENRVIIELLEDLKEEEINLVKERLKKVFGISYFALAFKSNLELDAILKVVLNLIPSFSFETFKVETKRANKNFPLNSLEISSKVGEEVLKNFPQKKVALKNPELTIYIEILKKEAFLYFEKIKGPGGLPVSTSGKVVSLLSGGIDSPVASWMIAKRGAQVILIHFHSYPYTSKASIEKAEKIAKVLAQWQGGEILLYLLPFDEIQKEIVLNVPSSLRMIFYRRAMAKISEIIAQKEEAKAIVTGESLGQVASQTLENILAIESDIFLPFFRPLIGLDKEEIVSLAKKIGTYEISILPHEDCCSRFLPKHPETKANLNEVKEIEKKLNLKPLFKNAISKGEKRTLRGFDN